MGSQPRMMTPAELDEIEHTLAVLQAGNHTANDRVVLALADLLTDARLAREEIDHLQAELRVAQHLGPR